MDRDEAQPLGAERREAVDGARRCDDHVAGGRLELMPVDVVAPTAGQEDERLRVRVVMQLGPSPSPKSTTKMETSEPCPAPSKLPEVASGLRRHDGSEA